MTDLTEQLYAGTLPTGHYYFNNGVETYIVLYKNINSKHLILQEPEGLTVISEVPSYEEWKALMDLYKEADVIIKKYDKENDKLKTDCKTLSQKLLQVKPELREWLEVNFKEYL